MWRNSSVVGMPDGSRNICIDSSCFTLRWITVQRAKGVKRERMKRNPNWCKPPHRKLAKQGEGSRGRKRKRVAWLRSCSSVYLTRSCFVLEGWIWNGCERRASGAKFKLIQTTPPKLAKQRRQVPVRSVKTRNSCIFLFLSASVWFIHNKRWPASPNRGFLVLEWTRTHPRYANPSRIALWAKSKAPIPCSSKPAPIPPKPGTAEATASFWTRLKHTMEITHSAVPVYFRSSCCWNLVFVKQTVQEFVVRVQARSIP